MEVVLLFLVGFLIGIKHAFDVDHVAAMNLLLTKSKNLFQSLKLGFFWGLGHSITLLFVGLIILILDISIPKTFSLFLELIVGLMLIFLGISSIHKKLENKLNFINNLKKSFSIGIIHGLAGSGALILLLLPQINNSIQALFYIIIFGIGTLIGMSLVSIILYYSFNLIKNKNILTDIFGSFSILVGIFLIYNIGFVQGLFLI